MPPPAKKTAPKSATTSDEVFVLFLKNINRIREYYKQQPGAGQALGYITMVELMTGLIETALEMAIAGKEWEPA